MECDACGECIWASDEVPATPVDVEGWTHGYPCPTCSEISVAEIHVDWRYRTFNGEFVADGDRVATVEYQCTGCDSVLDSNLCDTV